MALRTWLLFFFFLMVAVAHAQEKGAEELEVEADTLYNRQDFEGAIKIYSRIIESAKENDKSVSFIHYKRALGYYNLETFDKALQDINKFISEHPDVNQALILRAFIYKGMGDTERQLADLTRLLESDHSNGDVLQWRALAYLDKEDFFAAKKDLLAKKAVQDDAETEMYLGTAYYGEGRVDSALVSLNKAIELDASYLPPYLYAGYYCIQEDQFELAVKYLDVALKVDPTSNAAMFYKGIALVEQKKEKEGCRCLTKAFEAGEDDAGDYLKEYCYGVED